MTQRMKNPAMVHKEALQALLALTRIATEKGGVPGSTLALVNLVVSQINGCSVCVEAVFKKKPEESHKYLYAATAWRDMPYFTEAERAALALAEAVTRQSDDHTGVTDDIWAEAQKHFDEAALAALLLQIVTENAWNRLNSAIRQPANAPWN